MNKLMILPLAAATALAAGCASNGLYGGVGAGTGRYDDGGYGYYDQGYYAENGRYDYDRPDPRRGGTAGTRNGACRTTTASIAAATTNIIAAATTGRPG